MPQQNTPKRPRHVRNKKAAGRPLNPRQKQEVQRVAARAAGKVVELKEHLQRADAAGVDWSGTIQDLTNGVTVVGDTISPSSLILRYAWDAGDSTNTVRTIIFQWNGSAVGDTPLVSDILESLNINTSTAPFAFPDRNSRQVYKILYDRVYAINTNDNRHVIDSVKLDRSSLPSKMTGNDASGTVDYKKVYALWISDSSAVSHPSITYASRFLYHDG